MDIIEITQPEFGERLRARRIERGMSQRALAGDTMTPSYISLIEHGSRVPSLDVVVRLARLLNTTLQDLLGQDVDGLAGTEPAADSSTLGTQLEVRRLTEMGDLDGSRVTLTAKLDELRKQGNDKAGLEFGIELLDVLRTLGAHEERLVRLDELLALPIVRDTPTLYLSLIVDRASTLRELGRLRDAGQTAQEAAGLLADSSTASSPERVRVMGVLTSVLCELGDFETARTVVDDMLRTAAEAGHRGVLGRAHWVASMAYSRMGQLNDAYDELARARKALAYEHMPVRDWLRFCRFNASILLDNGRDLDAAREWIETAEVTAKMTALPAEVVATRRERARYELVAGNLTAAVELYTALVADAVTGSDRVQVLLGLGEALERSGRTAEAIARYRAAAEYCEENGNYRKAAETWRRIDQLRQTDANA